MSEKTEIHIKTEKYVDTIQKEIDSEDLEVKKENTIIEIKKGSAIDSNELQIKKEYKLIEIYSNADLIILIFLGMYFPSEKGYYVQTYYLKRIVC